MVWHKFGAKRTIVNGISFPSKLESAVYSQYLILLKAGEIEDLLLQSSVTLKEKCPECGDGPVIWKVDFSFMENGKKTYAEAKGVETSDYKKRKKLWKRNPPAKLYIWKGTWRYPKIVEIIE